MQDNKSKDTIFIDKVRVNAPIALTVMVAIFIITTTAFFVNFMSDTNSRLEAVETQTAINTGDIEETRAIVIDIKLILVELVTDVKWLRSDREESNK